MAITRVKRHVFEMAQFTYKTCPAAGTAEMKRNIQRDQRSALWLILFLVTFILGQIWFDFYNTQQRVLI